MGRPKGSFGSKRVPRRYKKHGKEIGNYFARIAGRDINLRTTNAGLALVRSKEAEAGTRAWIQDDGDAPVKPAVAGTEPAKTGPVVEPPAPAASGFQAAAPPAVQPIPPTHTAPAALPPIGGPPPGQTPPQREEARPDTYYPPPAGWADAVRAAAGGPGDKAPPDADDDEGIDPDFLEGMIQQAAALAVELQLMLQAWILKKRAELRAGEVPAEGPKAKARVIGAKIWEKELRKAIPSDFGLPGWVAAPLLVAAYGLPVQIMDGTPIQPGDPTSSPAPGPSSAPSPSASPAPPDAPPGETI